MAVAVCLLLLATIHILSATAWNPPPKATSRVLRGGIWIQPGRSVLVHVGTPDLPLWNEEEQIGEEIPSAFILNFTVSTDSKTLLLQNQPFMPLSHPHIPPRLSAPQTSQTLAKFRHGTIPNLQDAPIFDLDYERIFKPRDSSIYYSKDSPTLMINLLGAGIAGHNALLRDERQQAILITLKDWNAQKSHSSTEPPNHNWEILDVTLWHGPRNDLVNPDDLKECTWTSWRCADFDDSPWYRYVFRQNFDEYGKIGSFRHMLVQRWSTLHERLGVWRMSLLVAVVASMVLSPIGYGLYKVGRWTKKQLRLRAEAAITRGDEECTERLLFGNEDLEISDESKDVEVERAVLEKGMCVSNCEGSLKPLPPVPAKTEDVPEASEKA